MRWGSLRRRPLSLLLHNHAIDVGLQFPPDHMSETTHPPYWLLHRLPPREGIELYVCTAALSGRAGMACLRAPSRHIVI